MANIGITFVICMVCTGGGYAFDQLDSFTDSLLREVISKISDEESAKLSRNIYYPSIDEYQLNPTHNHEQKEQKQLNTPHPESPPEHHMDKELRSRMFMTRHDNILDREPSIRDQEYMEHSSLFGHQYVQGGAGEGNQRLKPDGSMKNIQVVKTDGVLPAYCNPPNPCPLGYIAEDGCLDDFVNSAAFSREYQASQDCMCDTEHMFDCPGTTRDTEIDALARSIQNEGLVDTTLNRLVEHMQVQGEHKNLVAKKFFTRKRNNPYLQGDKLPVVAKKTAKTRE